MLPRTQNDLIAALSGRACAAHATRVWRDGVELTPVQHVLAYQAWWDTTLAPAVGAELAEQDTTAVHRGTGSRTGQAFEVVWSPCPARPLGGGWTYTFGRSGLTWCQSLSTADRYWPTPADAIAAFECDDWARAAAGQPLKREDYEARAVELDLEAYSDASLSHGGLHRYSVEFFSAAWPELAPQRVAALTLARRRMVALDDEEERQLQAQLQPQLQGVERAQGRAQIWEPCPRCGQEPIYLPAGLCQRCGG